jgi:hypothetical protein
MKFSALALIAVFLCSTSYAEIGKPIPLLCEHDGGVNTKTGLRDGMYGDIFGFAFDPWRKEIHGFGYADKRVFIDNEDSEIRLLIQWGDDDDDNEVLIILVNRYTGTLFAKRSVRYAGRVTEYIAKGQCVKNDENHKLF